MTRTPLILVLCALAAPALAQGSAGLQPVPKFRHIAVVAGDVVRIGDLIDGAGALADIAIFRAPDLGATGSVPAARVLDAVRAYNMLIVDTDGASEIEVRRASRSLAPKDMEARIVRALTEQYALGSAASYAINLDQGARALVLNLAAAEPQIARAYFDWRSSRFDVVFNLPGNAGARQQRYTGTLVETAEVATLVRPVGRGETIRASDVAMARRPKAEVTADIAGAAEDAVGMAARQPLRAGQPLHRTDLIKAEVVRRDDLVTLVLEVPGILLTTRGKAIDAGAVGDTVSVVNIQSKRTVQGVVSGPGRVSIAASMPPISSTASAADMAVQRPTE